MWENIFKYLLKESYKIFNILKLLLYYIIYEEFYSKTA